MNILIIEDEPAIAENLIHVLEMDGYQVDWFSTAGEGLAHLKSHHPDLLVLDVGLPDGNGFELCKTIRDFSAIPIIFLTARNDEIDRVVGLEIGADDYVTKPFSPREMLARIKLRIKSRPTSPTSEPEMQTATSSGLYAENFDYSVNGEHLGLTAVEFKILHKLIEVSANVLSREQLMVAADMTPDAVYERNIDSHIKAIRNKLKPYGMTDRICTKRGFGYYYLKEQE
ncbi:Beta-lactamase response regulator [Vibrio nigripulchritudo SFn27]|uniref:Beta-lactamase response regulator n=1 Tax=Vibrio nigripulchritudo TaxID=28173 RepID=U4KB63_9VIBR|nr:response regulator [Vibrio nigripulchritudo]CCN80572.1 Beta-lactamase response regulator [Vibrio nigripulchritudo BLFn1]CCN90616.1 Beta-lactamase response regulator [Vibrio nigripulchritudo SFn27]CCN93447.1 Beta-lactamase response regulator [Vibrio nigripulchritudo ENn2]CCO41889.1 Beta-lactamase response regulator [Vibrio nigripulchritudo SFn135]CCO52000.1 Beta-lactamase response regulator [Vibrio nigripulchritudo Wn13]